MLDIAKYVSEPSLVAFMINIFYFLLYAVDCFVDYK